MATPSQIIAALSIENTTRILYPTAPKNYSSFEDITDWAGLGYSTGAGDTVEGIFQVVDPTGQVVYENAGFAGNDFSSPDWDLTDLVVANYNLLTYTGTDTPIYGDYTVNLKVKASSNNPSISGVFVTSVAASALPNNVLTLGTPSAPPFSTVKLFVLGNVAASLMNEGDIYSLTIDGDTIDYTIPSATQTVQQFYQQLNLAIIAYQGANPSSDWNNVGGSFGSTGNQYWLNLNRTDAATIDLTVGYTPFGTKQVSSVVYGTYPTPFVTPPTVGSVVGFSLYGEQFLYTVQNGDTIATMVSGIYDVLQQYITDNPSSDTATLNTYLLGSSYIQITSVSGNTPFTATIEIVSASPELVYVEKSITYELNANLKPTQSLELTYDCNQATFTSTDTTVYGAPSGTTLQTITRTHITRPPLTSKRSDGTTAQSTVSSSSQTNFLSATNNPLWTGSYDSSIAAILTYKNGNDYTYVNVAPYEKSVSVVCDSSLCTLFCYLKKLYNNYFENRGVNSVVANQWLAKWQLGSDIYALIARAQTCATNDVAGLYQKFYDVTGFTEGCDCGCDGDTSAPVLPTVSINGTNGTNGLTPEFRMSGTLFQWKYTTDAGWTTLFDFASIAGLDGSSFLQGSGVPSNALGENGDSYLNIANGDVYLKSAGTWAVTGNIKGASGAVVLYNEFPNADTTGLGWETLGTYTLLKTTLGANGDEILVNVAFTTPSSTSLGGKEVRLSFNGNPLNVTIPFALIGNITRGEIKLRLVRTSNTTTSYELKYSTFVGATGGENLYSVYNQALDNIGSLNFTTTDYAIEAEANSDVIGDITLESFEIIYLKKQ
jgi:hypothetical protein